MSMITALLLTAYRGADVELFAGESCCAAEKLTVKAQFPINYVDVARVTVHSQNYALGLIPGTTRF